MYYFAYGSNMALARIRRRLPSVRRFGPAWLPGYQLLFNVASSLDGSAKCNAEPSDNPTHRVLGVLFQIDPNDKPVLDRYEGVGVEYRDEKVRVILESGGAKDALVYLGIARTDSLLPYDWYKEHVIRGALENGLPDSYVSRIESVASIDDPDRARAEAEFAIYR